VGGWAEVSGRMGGCKWEDGRRLVGGWAEISGRMSGG
jgi:hypothetical protein